MKTLKRILWLLSGILLIVCGMFILLAPGQALNSISLYIGVAVLVAGVIGLIAYFSEPRYFRSSFMLYEAVLDVVFGGLLLISGAWQLFAAILPMLFSVWVIVKGFIGIIDAIESRYIPGSMWGLSLVLSIVFVVLGVLSMMNPIISTVAIAVICGMSLIMGGITIITMWARARKFRRNVKQWRASLSDDETAFMREYPMLYAILKKRMIDGEFVDDEEA